MIVTTLDEQKKHILPINGGKKVRNNDFPDVPISSRDEDRLGNVNSKSGGCLSRLSYRM